MAGYEVSAWSDFAAAVTGAAGALTGLLFVAVSLNLQRILRYPALPVRASQTLVLLASPLLIGVLLLVPWRSRTGLGIALLFAGVVLGGLLGRLSFPSTSEETPASLVLARIVPSSVIGGCLLVAGVSVLAGQGGGLYWVAPATIVAIVAGLANAWVLLVEIQR